MITPPRLVSALIALFALVPAAQAITYRNPAPSIAQGQFALGIFAERIERDTEAGTAPSRDTEFGQLGLSADYGLFPGGALGLSAAAVTFKPKLGTRPRTGEGSLDGMESGLFYRHNLSGGEPLAGASPFSGVQFGVLAAVHRGMVDNDATELHYTRVDLGFGAATPLGGPLVLYGGLVASDLQGDQTDLATDQEVSVAAESKAGLFVGAEVLAGKGVLAGVEIHGGSDMGLAAYALWLL